MPFQMMNFKKYSKIILRSIHYVKKDSCMHMCKVISTFIV